MRYHRHRMKCPNCLQENPPGLTACKNCGTGFAKAAGMGGKPAAPHGGPSLSPPPGFGVGSAKPSGGGNDGYLSDEPSMDDASTREAQEKARAALFGSTEDLGAADDIGMAQPSGTALGAAIAASGLPPEAFAPFTEEYFRQAAALLPALSTLAGTAPSTNGQHAQPSAAADDFFEVTPTSPANFSGAPPIGNLEEPTTESRTSPPVAAAPIARPPTATAAPVTARPVIAAAPARPPTAAPPAAVRPPTAVVPAAIRPPTAAAPAAIPVAPARPPTAAAPAAIPAAPARPPNTAPVAPPVARPPTPPVEPKK